MATIGTFKKTGTEYTGEIFTLSPSGLRVPPLALLPRGNRPPLGSGLPPLAEQQTILERLGHDWAKMLVDQGCGLRHLRPTR